MKAQVAARASRLLYQCMRGSTVQSQTCAETSCFAVLDNRRALWVWQDAPRRRTNDHGRAHSRSAWLPVGVPPMAGLPRHGPAPVREELWHPSMAHPRPRVRGG